MEDEQKVERGHGGHAESPFAGAISNPVPDLGTNFGARSSEPRELLCASEDSHLDRRSVLEESRSQIQRVEPVAPLDYPNIASSNELENIPGLQSLGSRKVEQDEPPHVVDDAGCAADNTHGIQFPTMNGNFQAQFDGMSRLEDEILPSVPLPPNGSSIADIAFLDSAASVPDSDCPRIQAFAKLEFDDGQFYMNTYSVELGRDIRAARVAFGSGFDPHQEPAPNRHKRSSSSVDASQHARGLKREETQNMANSVVSETGGIIGVDISDAEWRRRTRKRKPKSTSSSSHNISRKSSMRFNAPQTDYQSLAMASLADPQSIDAITFLPSPDECPLIPIHPPAVTEGTTTGHRGISRRHVRIAYNFEKRLFEVEVKGKNGAFVDEQYFGAGDVHELRSGSYIQIGGVGVRFVLPDVAIGETGAEGILGSDPVSGGAMSFDFEDGRGESITMADTEISTTGDDELSLQDDRLQLQDSREIRKALLNADLEEDEDEEEEEGGDEDEEGGDNDDDEVALESEKESIIRRPKISLKMSNAKPDPQPETKTDLPTQPPKRKGPGRPPKNGIISKREQALIARQIREAAKAEQIKNGIGKGKTVKPAKDTTLTSPQEEGKPEKRKYTKRKKVEDHTEENPMGREMTEKTDSMPPEQAQHLQPPKPIKEKRPPKPPRSPSPVFDEATLTAEQLAKPSQSYVVLIHEALTNSKTGAMSLPQIYRAIERRYPYYKLRVQTTGWQSSVRHNLSQHPAFRKIERDGKGWMWGLVPEISIEKEKKRRPSPPPMPPQHYYQQGPPHMYRHPYPYSGMPSQNDHILHPMGRGPYMIPGIPPPHHRFPPHPATLPRALNGIPLPMMSQSDTSSTYQSPYQPPPPSQTSAPPPNSAPIPPQNPQSQPESQPHPPDQNGVAETPASVPPPPPPLYHTSNPQAPNTSPRLPPPSSPSTLLPQPGDVGDEILEMVGKFKKALLVSLGERPHAEEIVTNAINRVLGIAPAAGALAKEYPEETPIMGALRTMLGNIRSEPRAQSQASTPAPQQTPLVQDQSTTPSQPQTRVRDTLSIANVEDGLPLQVLAPTTEDVARKPAIPNPPPPPASPPSQTPLTQSVQAQAQLLQLLQHLRPTATVQTHPARSRSPSANSSREAIMPNGVKSEQPAPPDTPDHHGGSLGKTAAPETFSQGLKRELDDGDESGDMGMGVEGPQLKRVAA
ncbi:hypothetical protein MMC19_006487 [Ptychographa xylographoides]|nr:hypothetical protein [Ptychographa xylographoides]